MRRGTDPAIACRTGTHSMRPARTRATGWREERGRRRPGVQGERSDNPGKGRVLARVAGVGALLVGVVLVALVLFGGDDGHKYKLLFETGGQLVAGNQVLVGGQPIGTVDEITLTEDAQAEVDDHGRRAAARGHHRRRPRDLALGDRQPLRLDLPGPQLRARDPGGRHDRHRPHDLPGRPRPALQHARQAHPDGAAGRDQGPGDDLHRQHRGGARDLQVLRAGPAGDHPPAVAELTRDQTSLSRFLVAGSTRPWARSPSAATTSPR